MEKGRAQTDLKTIMGHSLFFWDIFVIDLAGNH
jgi:hypothetical protein